ncbi:zinc-ribbon domain-containing protein [Paenibacillus alginolyticus]
MFCRNCGTNVIENSKFCISCGYAIEKQQPEWRIYFDWI